MPVSIEAPRCWKVAVEYFPVHELEYIAELIFQLAEDERAEQLKHQPLIDEHDDSTSSSSFSLPESRSDSICTEWKKNDFINCWLNDGKLKRFSMKYSRVFVLGFSKIADEDKSLETDLVRNFRHIEIFEETFFFYLGFNIRSLIKKSSWHHLLITF